MKSYKDKRLVIGLLFLGIMAGMTGRFFETQKFTFPSAGNLNQAAAILATQENIVGTPSVDSVPTVSLGFSDSLAANTDISFTRQADCDDTLTIKSKDSYTVGLLCLKATDEAIETKTRDATAQVNALVVSFNFGTGLEESEREALAIKAVDSGAVMIIGFGPKASADTSFYNETPIIYSLGEPATTKVKHPKSTTVRAELTKKQVSNITFE